MSSAEQVRWFRLDARGRERLREAIAGLLSGHPWVQAAYLYGSAARGSRPSRDLDIGLVADPVPEGWSAELDLAADSVRVLGDPRLEVDLRILNRADPVFLRNVLTDGELLYERDREARIRFEAQAMAQWLDFRPVWERVRARVLRRWSGG